MPTGGTSDTATQSTIVGGYVLPDDAPEPVAAFRLRVEIADQVVAYFTEVSGLGAERDATAYPEGGVNDHVHQLPGGVKYPHVVLRRGLADESLWSWFLEGLYDVKVKRQKVTISVFNVKHDKVKRWTLTEALPVKWTGPDLKSESNMVAIETLELVHHGLAMEAWTATG